MKSTDMLDNLRWQRFGLRSLLILAVVLTLAAATVWLVIYYPALPGYATIVFAEIIVASLFAIIISGWAFVRNIKDNGEKLETIAEMTNRNNELLSQIAHNVKLSDSVKDIAFHNTEITELKEAVLGTLHQHDFNSTYAMIDSMARRTEYQSLAEHLRKVADKYRYATEEEQINQAIAHIDKLCAEYHWLLAADQIKKFQKAFPYSEKAQAMSKVLREKKDERKKQLLAVWDEAVQNEDTDRSLEILRELDLYLTPTEGLALQESASSVFRTKLHSLGVQFSVAVTEKQWEKALKTGQEIVRDFPNSRMAHEIRAKMEALSLRSRQQKKT